MAFEIIWSRGALAEVAEIVAFSRARSEAYARKLGESLFASVEVLVTFPGIGPVYERDPLGAIRQITHEKYRIFYAVDDHVNQVQSLAVRHAYRRDSDPKQLTDRTD